MMSVASRTALLKLSDMYLTGYEVASMASMALLDMLMSERKRNKSILVSIGLESNKTHGFPEVVICPAIGAAAAVATTKFPSQLSTHLTRVVFTYTPFLPIEG